jgi:hypothetical protein
MDMPTRHQDQLIFHLSGKRSGDGLLSIDGLRLRPALMAPYRELRALRHDFPLVLALPDSREFVQSLSNLVNAVLRDVAPRGIEGERLRRHGLQLERHIRTAVADGARGELSGLWAAAASALVAGAGHDDDDALQRVLSHAGEALRADGEVLGCTDEMPARLLTHAWQAAQRNKARQFQAEASRLALKLSDILRAARSHSQAGRQPDSLKSAVGGPHRQQFDFEALSRIVGKGVPLDELPAARRRRLEEALAVLESQRFFAPPDGIVREGQATHGFAFDNCADATAAFRERLAELAALVKAISIAELEVAGRYVEAEHDLVFGAFGEHSLTADDLARFPDYLVCIPPQRNDAPENARLMEMLSSAMPVKVLVQTNELLEDASIGTGRFAFGVRSARLATTAMGLGGMFVLQSAASNLYALRHRIHDGMRCREPALFSVYTPVAAAAGELPPYLLAAAAMHSRAFPAFTYDAAAGDNWAERFSLENNPQGEDDWPVEPLAFDDAEGQRASVPCAFTYADFMLCDPRQAAHFALVPRERWSAAMVPAAEWLALDERQAAQRVPYLLAVDPQDTLQRVLVDAKLMQATRRCVLLWRRLQEHAGVHDSHAERLLVRERAAWAATLSASTNADRPPTAATAMPDVAEAAATTAHSRDEAWIDTARCPSCNECQLINDRMFGYDERKQAYIKDLAAGTYRQLVEAAESCQVAIIHPGKPRDPKEPGLDELLARAEAFR